MAFTRPRASQINFDTTNITDTLIRINSSESGDNANDLGIIFERGNHTNAAIVWDESADAFRFISTTHDASTTTSDINISAHHNLHVGALETTGNVTVGGNLTVTGTTTTVDVASINITNSFSFEGATPDGFETTLTVADPTADRTITLPDVTGYAAILQSDPGTTLITATVAELNYVDGVTSNIQTQIDNISSSFTLSADNGTNDTFTTGETLTIAGGTGIDTTVSDNNISIAIDSTVATLTGTQILTNKTINTASNTITIVEADISDFGTYLTASDITGKLNLSGGTMSGAIAMGTNKITGMGDPTAAQDAATKAYVDSQVSSVPTGDITAVNITAGTGLSGTVSTASGDHTQTLSIDSTVATLTGSQILTNKTLTSPTINAFSGTGNGSITGTLSIVTTTTDDSLLITTTEDSSSAAPVLTLKRNSSSVADADYLGQIKFKGENDADQEVIYAKITAKILDASDGTEDGIIEIAHKKAGSNVITSRFRSDSYQLLNGTQLTVDGDATFNGLAVNSSQTINMGSNRITTVADPTSAQDAATKAYTDSGTQTLTNKTLTSPQIGTDIRLNARAELEFYDTDSSHYVSFRAPATVATNITWTLPNTDGTDGQMLSTNGAGTLSWADGGGGGGSGSSYPNSTFTTVPGTDGDFDLSYNVAQTSQETPFEAGGTDAFGVNLGSVFSLMDPIGTTESIDYGDSEAYVGA